MTDGSDWCDWYTDSPETRKRMEAYREKGKAGAEGDQGNPNDPDNIKRLREEYNIREWAKGDNTITTAPETSERMEAYREKGKAGAEGDQGDPNDPDNIKRLREEYNISEGAKGDNPITTAPETSERMEAYRKDAANIEKNRIWKSEIEKMKRKSDLEKRRKIEK